jgi:hypothetical protein
MVRKKPSHSASPLRCRNSMVKLLPPILYSKVECCATERAEPLHVGLGSLLDLLCPLASSLARGDHDSTTAWGSCTRSSNG